MSNSEITFELLEFIGTLSEKSSGRTKELNIISWNGGPAKFDIREWDTDHERWTRGLTLSHLPMARLVGLWQRWTSNGGTIKDAGRKVLHKPADGLIKVHEHIGILEKAANGTPTELNIVSENGGPPMADVRSWVNADYNKPTRGVQFTEEEMVKLCEIFWKRWPSSCSKE